MNQNHLPGRRFTAVTFERELERYGLRPPGLPVKPAIRRFDAVLRLSQWHGAHLAVLLLAGTALEYDEYLEEHHLDVNGELAALADHVAVLHRGRLVTLPGMAPATAAGIRYLSLWAAKEDRTIVTSTDFPCMASLAVRATQIAAGSVEELKAPVRDAVRLVSGLGAALAWIDYMRLVGTGS